MIKQQMHTATEIISQHLQETSQDAQAYIMQH